MADRQRFGVPDVPSRVLRRHTAVIWVALAMIVIFGFAYAINLTRL
jgi:hypothetical protein